MPNRLSIRKKRVSYAEDREVLDRLWKICRAEKRTLTEVIREAVAQYLVEQKPGKKDAAARRETKEEDA